MVLDEFKHRFSEELYLFKLHSIVIRMCYPRLFSTFIMQQFMQYLEGGGSVTTKIGMNIL
jgi:hypothetical protein